MPSFLSGYDYAADTPRSYHSHTDVPSFEKVSPVRKSSNLRLPYYLFFIYAGHLFPISYSIDIGHAK